ncbi:MAG: hypothetical protein ACTSUK_01735 [Promethearchaeota archaeon]
MIVSKCTCIEVTTKEMIDVIEAVTWLQKNQFLLAQVKSDEGLKFYIPNSIFDLWVKKFDVRNLDNKQFKKFAQETDVPAGQVKAK